jgi:formylglycine-generating enzyme required for sulfatase activity
MMSVFFDSSSTALSDDAKGTDQRICISTASGIELILIPAGEFEMGSRVTEEDLAAKFARWNLKDFPGNLKNYSALVEQEQPAHRVKISRSFYLSQCEVTVGQFRQFVTDDGYKTEAETNGKGGYGVNVETGEFRQNPQHNWRNPGFRQTDEHPVVNVTWDDARKFCEWLSQKEGLTYRLPTEAEWEYACKAGTNSLWSHGDDLNDLALVGNVCDETAKEIFPNWKVNEAKDGYVFTAPVGKLRANAFGLHDMHGNVAEWCQDVWDTNVYAKRTGLTVDPEQTSGSDCRIVRGGSWLKYPIFTRSADRNYAPRNLQNNCFGFRIVKTR